MRRLKTGINSAEECGTRWICQTTKGTAVDVHYHFATSAQWHCHALTPLSSYATACLSLITKYPCFPRFCEPGSSTPSEPTYSTSAQSNAYESEVVRVHAPPRALALFGRLHTPNETNAGRAGWHEPLPESPRELRILLCFFRRSRR